MSGERPHRVADYFVLVGLNDLKKPEVDGETLEPIIDICVIFKSAGEHPPDGYECIEITAGGLSADLNHGSLRSPSCFLCYKRGRDKPPLTDIGVLYEGKQRLMPGCDIIHKTPTGLVANVNNAGNMRIFITYRRASPQFSHSSLAVIEICVVISSKGEKPPHAFCLINKNLNQGLVGSDVHLCYRKSLTRTNSVSYKAEVISRYPIIDYQGFGLPDSVPLFCLPLGAVVECWPEKAQPPLPIFSTFALTGIKGEKIFGAGVTFFEELPEEKFSAEVTDLLETQQKMHSGEVMKAHTNKCICLLSHYPFFDAFRKFLLSLYRISVSGGQTVPLERYISHFMLNVPFPTPQRPRVLVQMTHEAFEIAEPSHGPLPVSGASYSALLRCLGTENVLVLLNCVLTEHKILIHSLRPALLTSVGEAITSLIFPFGWQCPYIPLCPLALADVLSAPIPFIYGIDSRYFDRSSPPDDITCVDLDTNMITQKTLTGNHYRLKFETGLKRISTIKGFKEQRAYDAKEQKPITWRSLPKKPGKILKDRLDSLFYELYKVAGEDTSDRAVEIAPLEADSALKRRKSSIEINIQEAFLRFHAMILKGYRPYLLPITGQPTKGSYDLTSLFDLQGFLKSRPSAQQKFFMQLTRTQLFIRFIEQRSLTSTSEFVLAFFDDCTEKCETNKPLIQDNTSVSQRTVVITPPDAAGLSQDEIYMYSTFPTLRNELYLDDDETVSLPSTKAMHTPPRSPVVGRTKHERNLSTTSAKKQANSPTLWARCLLGHCYTVWFIHLPSYIKGHHDKKMVLYTAFELLQRVHESKAQLPDEVCYRVLILLSGQYEHPALAVKVLFEMKARGITPNAVTWGYYQRTVLESKWPTEKTYGKRQWLKLKHVIFAILVLRKGIKKNEMLITFDLPALGPNEQTNVAGTQQKLRDETCSVGDASDGGYSSMMSIDGSSRQQPIAGGLNEFPTDFPDLDQRQGVMIPTKASSGHRRDPSITELSEADSELDSRDSDFILGESSEFQKPAYRNHARRLSETSIGSNLSSSIGSNQIIICHDGVWQDSYEGTTSLIDTENEPRLPFRNKSDIAMEAVIGSCQTCNGCGTAIYDEEIMAGWSADDSNLNTMCPFCSNQQVPQLQIKIRDYRGLHSKMCSTSSLGSDTSSICHSTSSAIDIMGDTNHSSSNPTLNVQGLNSLERQLFSPPNSAAMSLFSPPSSKPVSIKAKRLSRDPLVSSSAPNSGCNSPVPGIRNSPRPAFYRARSRNNLGSLNMFIGTPEEKPVISFPYLSPLVLRKELESLIENDGDTVLQQKEFVTQRAILFWNLVWYFRRLAVPTHLHDLILQSSLSQDKSSEEETPRSGGSRVIISTSWDNECQAKDNFPLYMQWNVPSDQQEIMLSKGGTSRNILTSVAANVEQNEVYDPLCLLLDERNRQQAKNPKIHWSLYRELLFLSLTACGSENIDIDSFDREFKIAYKEVRASSADMLCPDDRPPTVKGVWCRRAFLPPTLQPRVPNLS